MWFFRQSKRVYISGTGRAGTSFLMELLIALGVDDGSTLDYFQDARAGFERPLTSKATIIKSPYLCDHVDALLASGVTIDHVVIPIRRISEAARSRRFVQISTTGKEDGPPVPGGLWETESAFEQEDILHRKLTTLIEALVRNDIPMTFLSFPRITHDAEYLYRKLQSVPFPHLGREQFQECFRRIAKPEMVGRFDI